MKCLRTYHLLLAFFILSTGCKGRQQFSVNQPAAIIQVKYAKGFTINRFEDHSVLSVRDPIDTTKILQQYFLYRDRQMMDHAEVGGEKILIPVQDIACLSTTHLGFLEALGLENKIVAFSGTKYIYNDNIRSLVNNGKILEAGTEGDMNIELLVKLHPDIIMAYSTGNEAYDHFEKLKSLHLDPVLNNEYLELTPLGEAEWIKFVAAFFDELDKADSIFHEIDSAYNSVLKLAENASLHPTVFTGLAFKGEWTVPGGKSFAAAYLKDAGARYLWNNDDHTGNFPVSLEEVIDKAQHADFWLHAGAAEDLAEIQSGDQRNTVFDAWKNKEVFNNNNRVNENGGNDYWESGVVSPDIILSDLIKIFHPELLPEHHLVYYKQLH